MASRKRKCCDSDQEESESPGKKIKTDTIEEDLKNDSEQDEFYEDSAIVKILKSIIFPIDLPANKSANSRAALESVQDSKDSDTETMPKLEIPETKFEDDNIPGLVDHSDKLSNTDVEIQTTDGILHYYSDVLQKYGKLRYPKKT